MKKAILSLLCISAVAVSQAQRVPAHGRHVEPIAMDASRATDTLYSPNVFNSPTIYGVQDQGPGSFLLGSNNYGDKAKCMFFLLDGGPTIIEGLLFWFGGKIQESGDPASHVTANVYRADGPGTTLGGAVSTAPGTIFNTADINIADCDTSGEFSVGMFASPIFQSADFYAGFDVTTLSAGDSVGAVGSEEGDVQYGEFTWEKWSDNDWYTLPAAGWGGGTFDCDMGVLVVVDNSTAGINEGHINGIGFDVVNNPAVDQLMVDLAVDRDVNLRLTLSDMSGHIVSDARLGQKSEGQFRQVIDVSGLANGTYLLSVMENGRGITKKVNIQR